MVHFEGQDYIVDREPEGTIGLSQRRRRVPPSGVTMLFRVTTVVVRRRAKDRGRGGLFRWTILAVGAIAVSAQALPEAAAGRGECVMLQELDSPAPYVSDPDECAVRTAPASTFKIPHALIALDLGVITDPLEPTAWDRTDQPFAAWERDHSLDSAMKFSVVWFFQRTAIRIGEDRMREGLSRLRYGEDGFEGDLTLFWLNGELKISPMEQLDFLRRLMRYEVPVARGNIDVVKSALEMPLGAITNATGSHDFELGWKGLTSLRAKTGNTKVGDERVSWIVGQIETDSGEYVFVSRVRANEDLSGLAGAELALKLLNQRAPGALPPAVR